MNDITVKSIDEVAPYEGPHSIPGVHFRALRGALDVQSWGMNVLDLEPHCEGHPEHQHREDGQEEVYIVLSGAVQLRADGRSIPLKVGDCARVPAQVTRKLVTTDAPARVLALGGTPGQAFTATL